MAFLKDNAMPDDLGHIEKTHLREFIHYLQTEARIAGTGKALSPATIQGYVRTLKAFFSWTEREAYQVSSSLSRIPVPKAPTKIIDTFSSEQLGRLIGACGVSNRNAHRNLARMLLLLDSGIRVSELKDIDLEDIDLPEGQSI